MITFSEQNEFGQVKYESPSGKCEACRLGSPSFKLKSECSSLEDTNTVPLSVTAIHVGNGRMDGKKIANLLQQRYRMPRPQRVDKSYAGAPVFSLETSLFKS